MLRQIAQEAFRVILGVQLGPREHPQMNQFHQGIPEIGLYPPQQHYLHFATAADPSTPEPCRNNTAVIKYQDVAFPQVIDDFKETPVLYGAFSPVQHHQPGVVSRLNGTLGDKLRRKNVIEIACLHEYNPDISTTTITSGRNKGN